MSFNRKSFYDKIRPFFGARILPKQVEGMEAIFNEWESSGFTDVRWLSYMLATTFHETAFTMQPIKEYGGKSYFILRYWENVKIRKQLGNLSPEDAVKFAGKGFVQITGRGNYKRMGDILGVDLVGNPELALTLEIATKIMFEGMTTSKSFAGDFTGKHLGNYFSKTANDPYNARRIINGIDKANTIAGYHSKFWVALQ